MENNYCIKRTFQFISFSALLIFGTGQIARSQIVINEVVTEPRQDWSANGFDGTAPVGSEAGTNDEWVELYVKTGGIDLTGWSLELLDGTDVTGDLTETGAFDVSNYIGSGSFTNSVEGDYLVLGNVDGSGAINNNITIKLKDPTGIVVDSVTFGTLPSSNSSDLFNESAQRMGNGEDTDGESDWTQGPATMGAQNIGPAVDFNVSAYTMDESSDSISIIATLNTVCGVTVEIVPVLSGSALEETDYSLSAPTICVPAGCLSAFITIAPIDDNLIEQEKTVIVDISSVTNGVGRGIQQFTLMITDDDVAPEVVNGQEFTMAVDAADGTEIGTLTASDGNEGTVFGNWTITEGNDEGYFNIDAGSGELTLEENPDFEVGETITMLVTVSDGANTSLPELISITFLIVNDEPPVIISSQSFTLEENNVGGTIVGVIEASDPDYGAELTWTILDGNNSGAFGLDDNGILTVMNSGAVDYETTPVFSLLVCVFDGLYSDEETVTVNIDNLNDNPPEASDCSFSIPEQSEKGTVVGVLETFDNDGDELTFVFASGNTGDAFSIDNSGTLIVNNADALEFDINPLFGLEITVGDGVNEIAVSVVVTLEEDPETGIGEIRGTDLKVYPNPVSEKIYIRFTEDIAGIMEIEIFNVVGNKVKVVLTELTNATLAIDVDHLIPGIYFLKVTDGNQTLVRKILVSR